jgi:hypothetical protein
LSQIREVSVEKVTITVTGKNMTFRIRVFFIFLVFLEPTWAQLNKPDWSSQYQSAVFEFPSSGSQFETVTAGRHPWPVSYFLNELVSWDPQDTLPALSEGCSAYELEIQLLKSVDSRSYNEAFKSYARRCEREFVQAYRPPYLGLLGMFAMKYSVNQNPFLRRTVIHLPNGQKLKAVLALKDQKKRPTVIVRMGITGNIEEAYAERFFYHHLFERGFYHLLMLENLTSTDFIHNNQVMDFGGISEAYQNVWIAQKMQSPEEKISELIDSVHLIGLSLGGQGVLASAWLAPVQTGKKLIASYLGLCPLVNLKPTFEELFIKNHLKFPLEFWARSRFAEIKKFRPELFDFKWGFAERLLKASQETFKKPAQEYRLNEPEFIKSSDDFYYLHNLSMWDPNLRQELRSWVTRQDRIVPLYLNSDQLPGLEPLVIEQGQHCSFPVEWHPHVTQALFNSHLLQNSKVQFGVYQVVEDKIINQDWKWDNLKLSESGEIRIVLRSQIANQTREITVSKDQLDFQLPEGAVDAFTLSVLKKWFSTNIRILIEKDKSQMTVSWPFVKN